jgi:predicted O-methyltransferase YrrM
MKHFYQNIQGWFSFAPLYAAMVSKFDNAIFVEVGSWFGRSSAYMAVEIINQNKNIKFYCVDTWEGSPELQDWDAVKNKTLYDDFLSNIKPVKEIINPIKSTSVEASKLFKDNSIDFCFIDADHTYEKVKEDIEHWYPKVKNKRVIAGHDYPGHPDVKRAVEEFANNNNLFLFKLEKVDCWFIIKNHLTKR